MIFPRGRVFSVVVKSGKGAVGRVPHSSPNWLSFKIVCSRVSVVSFGLVKIGRLSYPLTTGPRIPRRECTRPIGEQGRAAVWSFLSLILVMVRNMFPIFLARLLHGVVRVMRGVLVKASKSIASSRFDTVPYPVCHCSFLSHFSKFFQFVRVVTVDFRRSWLASSLKEGTGCDLPVSCLRQGLLLSVACKAS